MDEQGLTDLYQSLFGRGPTPSELSSDLENFAKYGVDRYLPEIQKRAASTNHRSADSQSGQYADIGSDPRTEAGYGGPAGTAAPVSTSWFAQNAPGGGAGGGGFTETYTAPARPDALKTPYTPETWSETYTPPTMDQVQQEPGFQTGLSSGLLARQRAAAANGSILNGGTQKALTRYGVDYGNTYFDAANTRMFDAYKQRYGQFQDRNVANAQARGINENAYQNDVSNGLSQYQQRYKTYQDAITNNMDYARLGLGATTAGAPA